HEGRAGADAVQVLGVHAVRKAVGDRDGRATIHLTASSEAHSLLGFQEGNPCEKWTKEVGTEIVDICTLDQWCRDSEVDPRRVDLLKLDVQGAELQALYGAKELLNSVRLIYLEVSFVPLYKDCPLHAEIDSFLKECGFRQHGIYPSDQPHHWGDALYIKT
ncbi:MAG: FkbM family methyltransferase, partial [Planctomycetes bacterium]|nr:FkbM family methyltransferase [Planctomycetota bacterium]